MKSRVSIVSKNGYLLGAGFLVAHDLVMTAAHCINAINDDLVSVSVEFENGTLQYEGPFRTQNSADLALVTLSGDCIMLKPAVPMTNRNVRAADDWTVYPADASLDTLTGKVDDPAKAWTTQNGGEITAVQLTCRQDIGDYRGYSGNPVEIPNGQVASVGAMVIEQRQDRVNENRATKVIYAISMMEISAFACLDAVILESLGIENTNDSSQKNHNSVDHELIFSSNRMKTIHDWYENGWISYDELLLLRPTAYLNLLNPGEVGD